MNPTQQATAAPVDDAPRVESIGEIVVFVDGYTDPTGIMEFAGVLAQEYDAHLTGVFMRPAPAVTPPEMFVRGTGIPNVIEARQAEVERIEADHRALRYRISAATGVCTPATRTWRWWPVRTPRARRPDLRAWWSPSS